MSKQKVLECKEYFGRAYDFLDGKTLREVIDCLHSYITDGWSEDAKFDVEIEFDGEIALREYRLETDEEEQIRLDMERRGAEIQRQKKLDEYEKLKKELGL